MEASNKGDSAKIGRVIKGEYRGSAAISSPKIIRYFNLPKRNIL